MDFRYSVPQRGALLLLTVITQEARPRGIKVVTFARERRNHRDRFANGAARNEEIHRGIKRTSVWNPLRKQEPISGSPRESTV